jgi:hypothetical protein
VPQFTVRGCLVETNVGGVADRVVIGDGSIVVLNWADDTLNRLGIWKLQESGIDYKPIRTWTIAETTIDLPTADGYFLYALLPYDVAQTTGTIIADTEEVYVKHTPQYLQYMLGYVNEASSPRIASMLWGNVKIYPQVQADWNEADTSSKAYILNKPTVVGATQSDWDETDPTDAAYILNKPTIPAPDYDHVIEFGFADADTVSSYDLDISAEFAYTIKHAWLRTDADTLTGVNVKINSTAVTGLDSISVTATAAKSTATAANSVVIGDLVTLNITPGTPTYIGGHLYIERT